MQRGKWIGVGVAAGLICLWDLWAENRAADPKQSGSNVKSRRTMQYFSRSGGTQSSDQVLGTAEAAESTSAAAPLVPNYYDALFGERAAAETETTDQNAEPRTLTLDEKSAGQLPPEDPFRKETPKVIHAAAAGDKETSPAIQLIESVSEKPNPFRQPTELGQTESTPSKPTKQPAEESTAPTAQPLTIRAEKEKREEPTKLTPRIPAATAAVEKTELVKTAPQTSAESKSASVATGPQTAAIRVEWVPNGRFVIGQECQCELVVKNDGSSDVSQVAVDAYFPASVRLTQADPEPEVASDHITWTFEKLAARQEQRLKVTMIPSVRGELAARSFVRFTGASTAEFIIEEPLLEVAIQGPTEVMMGDPASQIVTVSNPGTGPCQNVVLEAVIPSGLEHVHGKRLMMELGALRPGDSRSVRLSLAAIEGGSFPLNVVAKGDGGVSAVASTEVKVMSASLAMDVTGPRLRYLGRDASYTVTLRNDGAADTNNVRVDYIVPGGFACLSAAQRGRLVAPSRSVSWFVGRVEKGKSHEVQVRLRAERLGDFEHVAKASGELGVKAMAALAAKVDGTAALLLKVADINDPVETGIETAYEIRCVNEGSKAAANVRISCELPAGLTLLRAESPVSHQKQGNNLQFEAIPELAPGEQVVLRVFVKGSATGQVRFRTLLTSDSIEEPLIVDEVTRFYGDQN